MATQAQVELFINLIAVPVINICKEKGWGVPSAIIAQAGLESAWGTSGLWKTCYNGWGMKWVSSCGTDYKTYSTKEQRPDGSYYTIQAKFRKYPDATSGIRGYFDFIESYKRYAPLKLCKNYVDFANTIHACSWATSLNYSKNIINTVQKYNLTRFDGVQIRTNEYSVGGTYTLTSDLYIRTAPDGEKIKSDSLTEDAYKKSKFDEYGNAILTKGARVTCKEIKQLDTSTWVRIPSGWICAKSKDKRYIQ